MQGMDQTHSPLSSEGRVRTLFTYPGSKCVLTLFRQVLRHHLQRCAVYCGTVGGNSVAIDSFKSRDVAKVTRPIIQLIIWKRAAGCLRVSEKSSVISSSSDHCKSY